MTIKELHTLVKNKIEREEEIHTITVIMEYLAKICATIDRNYIDILTFNRYLIDNFNFISPLCTIREYDNSWVLNMFMTELSYFKILFVETEKGIYTFESIEYITNVEK